MPQREATRARRHRDRGDHRRQQRDEREETLRAFERALHLRASALEALDPLAARELLRQRRVERPDRLPLARHQQAIGDAAAGGDQLRRRQVGHVDHHAWREVDELRAAVRLDG